MMYIRGAQADYDGIVDRGNPGWGWDDAVRAFKAMEDHQLGASPIRGVGGKYGVSIPDARDPVNEAVLAAASRMGLRVTADFNADDDERIALTPSSVKNGRRVSAASAFLKSALKRPNVTLMTRTKAANLLFDGDRIVGVRAERGSGVQEHRATKEVVLAAGAVETPLLLERSGIGNPEILKRHGIDVRVDSPNVGERVIEQRCVSSQFRLARQIGMTTRLNSAPKQGWEGLKYLLTRRGPISTPGWDVVSQFKSSPGLDRPDIQALWTPMALDISSPALKLADHAGFMCIAWKIRPQTEGSIHIGGPSPADPPVISPRFLETDEDRRATAPILDKVREITAQSPLAELVADEEFPGTSISTHEQVVRYAHDTGAGQYHAVGSAAMGPNDDDVVDPDLRVRGVSGLRIVDTSVFRSQPAGNTAAPTMAVAWLAADRILLSTK
jgi:choline dehydrogenase-like flavoprotein